MKINDAGQYVSDDAKWVWDGEAWQPANGPTSLAAIEPDPVVEPDPPEAKLVPTCAEQDCLQPASDYVRIAMQGVVGSITVEVLLCTMHIATMEMGSQGQFLFIRPRNRLDLNGH